MFPRSGRKGTVGVPKLQRLSDPELIMVVENALFTIGRAATHLDGDRLRSAQQELPVLESALAILQQRHP